MWESAWFGSSPRTRPQQQVKRGRDGGTEGRWMGGREGGSDAGWLMMDGLPFHLYLYLHILLIICRFSSCDFQLPGKL
ncbi:hypothetical protein E2C01_090007 [Portunus trituberculatus]|uniref:Uncharacterized protein n=1 Tax=Portunus trituberculatus TaxID=210409 RepID=A0A5B7JAB7_PORTR|nr:hypothetical protein [Portunus trituberculatus]